MLQVHLRIVVLSLLCFLLVGVAAPQEPNQPSITIGLSALKPSPSKQGAPQNPAAGRTFERRISGSDGWVDSQIDLSEGARVQFSSTGTLRCLGSPEAGPDGLVRGWKDLLRVLPLRDSGHGALIGRIGTGDSAQLFVIGSQKDLTVISGGRLFLGLNLQTNEQADGSFAVNIQITPASSQPSAKSVSLNSPSAAKLASQITPELLKQIPARVSDPDGRPGDMVNFLIVGAEDRMRLAFDSAGWVKVDRTSKDAVLHGLLSSLSKESYVEMPMSILTLFDRPQDFGFAHAVPFSVIMTRHHLRVWKAPFQIAGQTVWVGAGTHDIGIEKDQRNGGVTHKIDPAVDGERDFIGDSLSSTGIVTARTYVTPLEPVTEAKTATGGTFHSDGRLLVMALSHPGGDSSANFAEVFCSVMRNEHPDSGDWSDCSQYIDGHPSQTTAALEPISTKYRVLILPGFLSSCVSSVPALEKGQEHLRDVHGLGVEFLTLPNESSQSNGKLITDYIKEHSQSDPRKYIVIGYSKGAPDFQEGLAQAPDSANSVAAFVSLAGAVGGSPVADLMPAIIDRYSKSMNLGTCQGDIARAFKSLRQDVRHEFLTSHPDPLVPTYSLVATSDQQNTSKMMMQAWQLLSAYDAAEDSQLTRQDAMVPGSVFLGALRADHLAVALGFADSPDNQLASMLDHNRYPRAALLESIVRFVSQDLERTR